MRQVKIMLGDLNYHNVHQSIMFQSVPINIGYIGQYVNQKFGKEAHVSLYKDPHEFFSKLKEDKPDIVALSQYIWNTDLNRLMIQKIRGLYGKNVLIALGGPSTDVEDWEKKYLLQNNFGADALILEEGEIPFSNVVTSFISNQKKIFTEPLDGVAFMQESDLVYGVKRTVQTDLTDLYSPYLSKILDKFLHSTYMPLIQMSRFCPYTCAFCTAGKTRGKLRSFPMDMVKDEIKFISKKFSDRPHFTLQVADENFGVFKRDAEIAAHIRECSDKNHFPRQMFFYSDKRFTDTVRSIVENLGSINKDGLPNETLESYCNSLDKCAKRGFDVIVGYSLWLMAGIPLNTKESREKFEMKTKFRVLASAYGEIDEDFSVEHEEIVVSTNTLNPTDFQMFRRITFLFYTVYAIGFYRFFIQCLHNYGISMTRFFREFMSPNLDEKWPKEYLQFISDFDKKTTEEIFDTREELETHTRKKFYNSGKKVNNPTRLNVFFGARLVYQERFWVKNVLKRHLKRLLPDCDIETSEIFDTLLEVGEKERVNIRNPVIPTPVKTNYDILSWKRERFKKSLSEYSFKTNTIKFAIKPIINNTIKSFVIDCGNQEDGVFYYNAVDNILPRGNQLYDLCYELNTANT